MQAYRGLHAIFFHVLATRQSSSIPNSCWPFLMQPSQRPPGTGRQEHANPITQSSSYNIPSTALFNLLGKYVGKDSSSNTINCLSKFMVHPCLITAQTTHGHNTGSQERATQRHNTEAVISLTQSCQGLGGKVDVADASRLHTLPQAVALPGQGSRWGKGAGQGGAFSVHPSPGQGTSWALVQPH